MSRLEKNSVFGPKTAILVNQDPNNSQLISQMGTHQETEIIESYLMIWGQYDPIKSSLSKPNKCGLYGCSAKT